MKNCYDDENKNFSHIIFLRFHSSELIKILIISSVDVFIYDKLIWKFLAQLVKWSKQRSFQQKIINTKDDWWKSMKLGPEWYKTLKRIWAWRKLFLYVAMCCHRVQ